VTLKEDAAFEERGERQGILPSMMHARTRPEVHPYPIPLAQDSGAR
jgi:hypothetical protein